MKQMYKVFVNDKPIIITSSLKKENDFLFYHFKNIIFDEIIYKLQHEKIAGITLFSYDVEKDWQQFISNIKLVPAAGGLVLNSKKEVLFIFRNGVWDLPKGHIEKDESTETAAIREVEEECGIGNLKITNQLPTTYHIYYQNGLKLKQTFWFLMYSDDLKSPKPQLEEGITAVVFKDKKAAAIALKNSYANIKLLYNYYVKLLI